MSADVEIGQGLQIKPSQKRSWDDSLDNNDPGIKLSKIVSLQSMVKICKKNSTRFIPLEIDATSATETLIKIPAFTIGWNVSTSGEIGQSDDEHNHILTLRQKDSSVTFIGDEKYIEDDEQRAGLRITVTHKS